MRSVVKVQWYHDSGWRAGLLLAEQDGFSTMDLEQGLSFEYELTDERRCTGYAPEKGEREPCPEFRKIESGSQCGECRNRDVYTQYVRGSGPAKVNANFSVYMAQIGSRVKVGVTRSDKLERRWVEQGADLAAEIRSGLSSEKALELESELSEGGLTERISKKHKLERSDPVLEQVGEQKGYEVDPVDVQARTVYPDMKASKLYRSGSFDDFIESVKGQIIGNGRMALALGSGRVLEKPSQQSLGSYS